MLNRATHHHFNATAPWRISPLWWFVSLSVLLHGAALLLPQTPALLPVSPPSSSVLAIQLSEKRIPAPAAALPSAARPAENTTRSALMPKTRAVATVKPESVAAPTIPPVDKQTPPEERAATTAAAAEPTATATTIDEGALQSSLQITMQQEIARYFSYPLLARRRGWQGEVLLAFRLEADGRIVDARIARSSGYGILDRAALTALGKVKRVHSGTSRGFAMQLPVIYRLEG